MSSAPSTWQRPKSSGFYVFDGHILNKDRAEQTEPEREGKIGLFLVSHVDLAVFTHRLIPSLKIMSPQSMFALNHFNSRTFRSI
jgi:hypothetical protein